MQVIKIVGWRFLLKQPALMGDSTISRIRSPVDLVSLIFDYVIMVKLNLEMMNLDWKWL